MSSASFNNSELLSLPARFLQLSKASFAADTAILMSSSVALDTVPRTALFAGLVVSRILPLTDSTNSLLMKRAEGTALNQLHGGRLVIVGANSHLLTSALQGQ